jgi:hypothetical protein
MGHAAKLDIGWKWAKAAQSCAAFQASGSTGKQQRRVHHLMGSAFYLQLRAQGETGIWRLF